MKVLDIQTDKLKPATYNPRSWDQIAINNLTQSIKQFGLVDPIIVNSAPKRKNIVIGGHFRLKIAKDLRFKEVPVVYLDIPDIKREKELNLRLNRNTGSWDLELLRDFDVNLLLDVGFDDSDLSAVWDEQLEIDDDNFNTQQELIKIKNPQTKTGQLIQLGEHLLLCGDATNLTDVKRLVGKNKIDLIYSDPPYNINLDYSKGISTQGKYQAKKTNDSKSHKEYEEFIKKSLRNGLSICKKDAHIFYWCDENYIWLIQQLYQELGIDHKRVNLWIKNNQNPTPQIAFNKAYEACVYGTLGKPYLNKSFTKFNEILNKEISNGNRLIDDVLDLFNIWLVKRKVGQEYLHPTEKPVALHEKPLKRCSKPGDSVLDLFGGSGSTLIACEQMKRRAFLIEIEPIFCDLIINRFQQLTGMEAIYVD
jgi:DNA modification methylase